MTVIGVVFIFIFVTFMIVGVLLEEPATFAIGLIFLILTLLFLWGHHSETKSTGVAEVEHSYVKTNDGRVYVMTPNLEKWYEDYNTVANISDSTRVFESYDFNFQGDTLRVRHFFQF